MKPPRYLQAILALVLSISTALRAQDAPTPPSWTSKDGRIIHAKFLKLEGESVVLEKGGKEVTVPFAKLSAASVTQAKNFGGENSQPTVEKSSEEHATTVGPPMTGKEIKITLPHGVDLRLCGVPAGEYKFTIALIPVKAQLSNLWLGKYEVTQAQWEAVMGDNPSEFKGKNQPVEKVSWEDARAFVAKLNTVTPLSDGWTWSLPTTTQWSYACYVGKRTAKFHFGDSCNGSQANVNGSTPFGTDEKGPNLGKTAPVGSYPANAWGLHDMHGNVSEWCRDAGLEYGITNEPPFDMGANDPRLGKDPLVPKALMASSTRPFGATVRQATGGNWKWGAEAAQAMNGGGCWKPFAERTADTGLRVAIVPTELAAKPD